jgi:hypothetical protein
VSTESFDAAVPLRNVNPRERSPGFVELLRRQKTEGGVDRNAEGRISPFERRRPALKEDETLDGRCGHVVFAFLLGCTDSPNDGLKI